MVVVNRLFLQARCFKWTQWRVGDNHVYSVPFIYSVPCINMITNSMSYFSTVEIGGGGEGARQNKDDAAGNSEHQQDSWESEIKAVHSYKAKRVRNQNSALLQREESTSVETGTCLFCSGGEIPWFGL